MHEPTVFFILNFLRWFQFCSHRFTQIVPQIDTDVFSAVVLFPQIARIEGADDADFSVPCTNSLRYLRKKSAGSAGTEKLVLFGTF
jgi:hypothetical protein